MHHNGIRRSWGQWGPRQRDSYPGQRQSGAQGSASAPLGARHQPRVDGQPDKISHELGRGVELGSKSTPAREGGALCLITSCGQSDTIPTLGI